MIVDVQVIDVHLTDADIAGGERVGLDTTPLSLALGRALGGPPVPVYQGSSLTPSRDVRALAPYEDGTRWHLAGRHVGREGYDVPLPRRAQIFASIWKYGPCGGQPFLIRGKTGEVIARRPYAEIIRPFSFTLERRLPEPPPLGAGRAAEADGRDERAEVEAGLDEAELDEGELAEVGWALAVGGGEGEW